MANAYARTVGLLLVALAATAANRAAANDAIGFVETFALAEDRSEVLQQLIPGTEEYYFYHALHYQNTGQKDKLRDVLDRWTKRTKSSGLRDLIQRRERLLAYDRDPKGTLAWLRSELGIHFSHQREKAPGQKPDLPTSLDPASVSREAFIRYATAHQDNLSGFQNSALDWILREGGVELTSGRRRALLSRLDRPDYEGLVDLILADFRTKESRQFGEFNIHRALLLAQMDELLEKKPDLRTNTNFIHAYLTKLAPDADADVNDPAVRGAHLERMWAFVKDLAPAHNSLKANVLYALLDHQRKTGRYDRGLFLTYVKLPRPAPYMEPRYLQLDDVRRWPVNLGQDFTGFTRCRPVGDDTPLVRDFLLHFLADEDDYQPWTEWIRDTFVKPLMAEAKIVSGAADPERWASMLSPTAYQALKDRVDIDLAATNPQQFAPDDEVALTAYVKNVKKLRVKIYQINALNVYLATGREIGTGLELDGLVAGDEKELVYEESPFRRVRREFTFPELTGKRGVWVIELIGGGRSSRALIRKGGLHYLSRQGVGGTVLSILDEADQPVRGASAWLAGREYKADKHGGITIPYSTSPGTRAMILQSPDGLASLAQFQHAAEQYTLTAGFFVDRESLRVGGEASLLVRPDFRVNGVAAPLEVLEEVKLTITSTNLEGVSTTQEIPGFELHADKESEHRFAVPPRLATLSFQLEAKVEQISTGKKLTLAAAGSRAVNAVDKSEATFDLHLSRMDGHAVLEVLGKTGERIADRAVRLSIEHRDFKSAYGVTLKSDEAGRIDLGELPDIRKITASSDGVSDVVWNVAAGEDAHSRPAVLHAAEGETIHVPHLGAEKVSRADYSLLERRGGTFTRDCFDALSVRGGFLAVKGLEPGDYSLKIKREGRAIPVRVTAGEMIGRFAAGKRRILETANRLPLHVIDIAPDKQGDLLLQLVNADAATRVHVLVARFDPVFPLHGALGPAYQPPIAMLTRPTSQNVYLSGRDIGDEHRYILERREQTPFPGNMLARPGLLLNPWAIRETDTGKQQAATGGEYADRSSGTAGSADGGTCARRGRSRLDRRSVEPRLPHAVGRPAGEPRAGQRRRGADSEGETGGPSGRPRGGDRPDRRRLPPRFARRRRCQVPRHAAGQDARSGRPFHRTKNRLAARSGRSPEHRRRPGRRDAVVRHARLGLRALHDAQQQSHVGRVRLRAELGDAHRRTEAGEVLEVRVARAEFLPQPEGSRVLQDDDSSLPEEQEGQDVPRPLLARGRPEPLPRSVALRPVEHGRARAAGPSARRRGTRCGPAPPGRSLRPAAAEPESTRTPVRHRAARSFSVGRRWSRGPLGCDRRRTDGVGAQRRSGCGFLRPTCDGRASEKPGPASSRGAGDGSGRGAV